MSTRKYVGLKVALPQGLMAVVEHDEPQTWKNDEGQLFVRLTAKLNDGSTHELSMPVSSFLMEGVAP